MACGGVGTVAAVAGKNSGFFIPKGGENKLSAITGYACDGSDGWLRQPLPIFYISIFPLPVVTGHAQWRQWRLWQHAYTFYEKK